MREIPNVIVTSPLDSGKLLIQNLSCACFGHVILMLKCKSHQNTRSRGNTVVAHRARSIVSHVLQDLEKKFPGISDVERDEEGYIIG